jgi:excisionase family DNA binding protein
MDHEAEETYLTPAQAARLLHVSPKTIARWADQGRLACLVTPGGHRRLPREEVLAVARQMAYRGGAARE